MPNQNENKFSGVCIVNVPALSAIIEYLNTTQVGKVLCDNLQSKPIANLQVDEVEYLNSYLKGKSAKTANKKQPAISKEKKAK